MNIEYRDKLLRSFLNALNGGFIWAYFIVDEIAQKETAEGGAIKKRIREKDLRELFAQLRVGYGNVLEPLTALNGFYKTRFTKKHLAPLAHCFRQVLTEQASELRSHRLLSEDASAPMFCDTVVQSVIAKLKEKVPEARRPYSLTT